MGLGEGRFGPAQEQTLWLASNKSFVKNQECRNVPETVYFPLGWDRGKAAPFLERDRVLSLLAGTVPVPRSPGRPGDHLPLPFGDGVSFPAVIIFSGTRKRRSDSQA